MNHCTRFVPLLLAISLGHSPVLAQGGDLVKEIQEIATRIDEQLQEIDRLLLESGKKAQPRNKPQAMLQETQERSREVEASIDELIQKLTEMKNQGGGGQSQSSDQQQDQKDQKDQQQQQRGQGQQNRRENQTPDFVKQPSEGQKPGEQQGQPQPGQPQPGEPKPGQPGQQPGQQPGEQPPPGQGPPQGGQDQKGPGENRQGNRQLEPELGPGQVGQGEGSWGELQSYTNSLKNRGSLPKVPDKYRKYWEAYLKSKRAGAGGSSGR